MTSFDILDGKPLTTREVVQFYKCRLISIICFSNFNILLSTCLL